MLFRSQHRAQVLAQLLDRRAADVPVAAVDIVHGEIGQQRKSIRDRRLAARLGRLHHIQLPDHGAILIAQEREARAEAGLERGIDLRRIDATDGELAVIYRQLFLEFG